MADTGKKVAIGVGILILLLGFSASASPPPTDEPDGPDPDPDPDDDDDVNVVFVPPGNLPPLNPTGPVAPVGPTFEPGEIDVDDWVKDYPTGGTFYQVRTGDILGGQNGTRSIAYRLLLTEAFLAAKNVGGLDDATARSWARNVAQNGNRIRTVIHLIQCSMINDMVYGTWGYGSQAVAGPHGRAIRLVPQHANNLQRLRDGEPLARNIRMRFPANAGDSSGVGVDPDLRSFELLYMPKLNEQILWDSGGLDLTTEGMEWPNGTDMGNWPPPWSWRGGPDNFDADADAFMATDEEWGCDA